MKILIIDGMNMFIRSFVVVPTMDVDGQSIGGITGFLKSSKLLIDSWKPDKVIVAWDGEGGSRRRRGIFAEYKAGRKVRLNREEDMETQDESFKNMSSQMKRLRTLIGLLGFIQIETPEVEADDIIAFLCKHVYTDDQKVVSSSDKDMLQLIDNNTIVFSPTKKVFISRKDMEENVGIKPENYVYVKSLMGDNSDNIPGVGGIGEKTALKLFPMLASEEMTVQKIRNHCEANLNVGTKYKHIINNWERFLENVKLMQLSSPTISAQAARTIRISALEQKPRFVFTEFKLQLIRDGIQVIDQDLLGVIQQYKFRTEKIT